MLFRSGAILAVYVAGQLVWTLWPERTMFFFYTVAYVPFLVLAIAYVAGLILARVSGTGSGPPRSRQTTAVVIGIGVFVLLALVVSAFFLPIWTGTPLPLEQWQQRMWFQSWI